MICSLSFNILRPTQGVEGATCIAELTTSVKVNVVAYSLRPRLSLAFAELNSEKLSLELHSGALIPGVLLPFSDNKVVNLNKKKFNVPLHESGEEYIQLVCN